MKDFEIERKWLLTGLPSDIDKTQIPDVFAIVKSFYLSISPEIRYRNYNTIIGTPKSTYLKTFKTSGTIMRKEINIEVTEEEYTKALSVVRGITDNREYYVYYHNGYKIEVNKLDDFIYCEVEFDSLEEAENYQLPDWVPVYREITDDDYYKMKNHYLRTVHTHMLNDMGVVEEQFALAVKELTKDETNV